MKKNLTLHSIGNEEDFNFYIFDKKQQVYFKLSKIIRSTLNLELYDEEHRKEINIEGYKDFHTNVSRLKGVNQESRIDIFYGDKKMFMVIHCPQESRLKFNRELFKIIKMPKIKFKKEIKRKLSHPFNKER